MSNDSRLHCPRVLAFLTAAIFFVVCGGFAQPARALHEHWQPAGIVPIHASLDAILGKIQDYRGRADSDYIERLRIIGDGQRLTASAVFHGADVRFAITIGGSVYASGRVGGSRWRQTPAGLVRITTSDIQGDPLDRWPVSLLPLVAAECELVGESRGKDREWVLQVAPAGDVLHWLYVDETTGAITGEVTRDGSQVFTTAFDDSRATDGVRRPYHWHITGFGGVTDVFVDSVEKRPVDAAEVAVPPSRATPGIGAGPPIRLPVTFTRDGMMVALQVNGHAGSFVLDTGTTEILVSASAARRFGITTTFNHGIATQLDIGKLVLRNLPVMTVPSIFGIDGILGYDFFAGSIVHIDYTHAAVEVASRTDFVPPPAAIAVPIRFDEGIPLVHARIGELAGDRFALDTGSNEVLLPRYLWETRGLPGSALQTRRDDEQAMQKYTFLEGPLMTRWFGVPDIFFANTGFTDVTALVEQTNAGPSLDVPFDAIFGQKLLGQFDWWFDYTGAKAWVIKRE